MVLCARKTHVIIKPSVLYRENSTNFLKKSFKYKKFIFFVNTSESKVSFFILYNFKNKDNTYFGLNYLRIFKFFK